MTPEQRKKLVEDMLAAYESRCEPSRGGPESAMRMVLHLAEQCIQNTGAYERSKT